MKKTSFQTRELDLIIEALEKLKVEKSKERHLKIANKINTLLLTFWALTPTD